MARADTLLQGAAIAGGIEPPSMALPWKTISGVLENRLRHAYLNKEKTALSMSWKYPRRRHPAGLQGDGRTRPVQTDPSPALPPCQPAFGAKPMRRAGGLRFGLWHGVKDDGVLADLPGQPGFHPATIAALERQDIGGDKAHAVNVDHARLSPGNAHGGTYPRNDIITLDAGHFLPS